MNDIRKGKKNNISIGKITLGLAAIVLSSVMASIASTNQVPFSNMTAKAYEGSNAVDKRMEAMDERLSELVGLTDVNSNNKVSKESSPAASTTMNRDNIGSTPTHSSNAAPSTLSQEGGDFTAQAELDDFVVRRTNNIVNTLAYYDIVFFTTSSAPIKTIEVKFPEGTIIGPLGHLVEVEGIGPGIAAQGTELGTETTLIYTVDDPVTVPASTKIRLEFSQIINPPSPSTDYKVLVTTKNAAGDIIDGPKGSVIYKVKQIGTADIANGAVTTNKLADGAISTGKLANGAVTAGKISPSFMVSRILNDGQNGWDPDGVLLPKNFIVSDPAVSAAISHVYISVDEPNDVGPLLVNAVCMVEDVFNGTFQVVCVEPPAEGSKLRYTVVNQA